MKFIRNFYMKIGFLLMLSQSDSAAYEFFGSNASGDSVVLLKIISVLINTQIFGLKIIEDSPMVTRESDDNFNCNMKRDDLSDVANSSFATTVGARVDTDDSFAPDFSTFTNALFVHDFREMRSVVTNASAAPMNTAAAVYPEPVITSAGTRSVSINASAFAAAAPSTINANLVAASLFSAARALPPAVRDRLSVIATIFSNAPVIASASHATHSAAKLMLVYNNFF